MAKAVQLSRRFFANKGLANAFFREILNRYRPGSFLDPSDQIEVEDLLSNHPDAAEKIGCGVSAIKVIAADYGTQCFCVVRKDLSENRFSYKTCLDAF